MIKQTLPPRLWIVALLPLLLLAAACMPTGNTPEPPTATPSSTPLPPAPRNDNVEALNGAAAAVESLDFGLAPLLRDNETRIELLTNKGEQTARMVYPQQPAEPLEWPGVDSFVLSYAVRQSLLDSPQVSRVAIGQFDVSASIDNSAQPVNHSAAWVTFVDGSRAIVDLSPLSTNFAPRHIPEGMIVDNQDIEGRFTNRRDGVGLTRLQPMLVAEEGGNVYYLLARLVVTYDQYLFALQMHQVQIADPMRPMELSPGMAAELEIDRSEFEALQTLLLDEGPDIFGEQPDLLTLAGKTDSRSEEILMENYDLLWHLITKLEHELPDPDVPTPTPVPTATTTPTPTPEPTATPKKAPLLTS